MDQLSLWQRLPHLLETDRLILRAIRVGDAERIFNLYAKDPLVSKYMSYKYTGDVRDTEVFVDQVASAFQGNEGTEPLFAWLIQIRDTQEYIGTCGLGTSSNFGVAGGYVLARQFWGKGYATEAWRVVVEWCKQQNDIRYVRASCHPENRASASVMQKVGMVPNEDAASLGVYPNICAEPQKQLEYFWNRPMASREKT